MGNQICAKKDTRKQRILIERAKFYVNNWTPLKPHLNKPVNFNSPEDLNQNLKEGHYEARNVNRVYPSALLFENDQLRLNNYEQFSKKKILSICPWNFKGGWTVSVFEMAVTKEKGQHSAGSGSFISYADSEDGRGSDRKSLETLGQSGIQGDIHQSKAKFKGGGGYNVKAVEVDLGQESDVEAILDVIEGMLK